MRNLFRVACILTLLVASVQAQQIFVAGVKTVVGCNFAVRPLIADLHAVRFPNDWIIILACTPSAWNYLQTKADARDTHTAFTNLRAHITVVNAAIYLEALPLRYTAHRTPRSVLEHERGHILCRCSDEQKADSWSGAN